MGVAYKLAAALSTMHRIIPPHCQACSCQQHNAYFEGISLERVPWRIRQLSLGISSTDALQSECKNCVACQKFVLKYFRERLKIRQTGKMKTCKNIALYGKAHLVEGIVSFPESILGVWEWDSSIQFSPSLPVADLPQLQVPLKTQR